MSRPVFVRLPPGADPKRRAYAVLTDLAVTYRKGAENDDQALEEALATPRNKGLACEIALADAAQRHGVEVRKLEPAELLVKATLSASLLSPEAYGNSPRREALMDFWEAARAFELVLRTETRTHWYVAAKATGEIDGEAVDRDLFLLVQTDPLRLSIVPRAVAHEMLPPISREPEELEQLLVDFLTEPAELRAMLREGMVLDAVPRVRTMAGNPGERGELVDDVTMELTAACLGTLAQHVHEKAVGLVYTPLLGGEVTIKLESYVKPSPTS